MQSDREATLQLLKYGANPNDVGHRISAIRPQTNEMHNLELRFPAGWIYEQTYKLQDFHKNAQDMQSLLIRCQEEPQPKLLCQCRGGIVDSEAIILKTVIEVGT